MDNIIASEVVSVRTVPRAWMLEEGVSLFASEWPATWAVGQHLYNNVVSGTYRPIYRGLSSRQRRINCGSPPSSVKPRRKTP